MDRYVGIGGYLHDLLVLVHEPRVQHVKDAAESLIGDNGMKQTLALIVHGAVATANDHRAARLRDLRMNVKDGVQRKVTAVLQS